MVKKCDDGIMGPADILAAMGSDIPSLPPAPSEDQPTQVSPPKAAPGPKSLSITMICPACEGLRMAGKGAQCASCGGKGELDCSLVVEVRHRRSPCCKVAWARDPASKFGTWVCSKCKQHYDEKVVFDAPKGQ